jgi:hypothetical protein
MTTVPGTYFTKEQLEAAIKGNGDFYFVYSHSNQDNELVYKVDNVSGESRTGSDKL